VSNLSNTLTNIVSRIKKNILWIIPLSILVGLVNFYFASQQKTLYKSYSKIFPMNASEADPLSGMKASLGMGSESNLSKYYNVNELVNSKHISRQIVAYPSNNSRQKKLYDWVINDYNNQQFWTSDKININTDSTEKIITASSLLIAATNIKIEKSEFTSIECTTGDKDLSLRLNECILQCLSDFYIASKTEKARTDLMNIGLLKDSLKGSLDYLERATAGFTDNSQYVVKDIANLPKMKLERLHEEIAEQYKTTAMAYQNANFKLLSESPIFQILDKPMGPVQTIVPAKKKSFFVGFAIALVLSIIFAIRAELIAIITQELKAI
jgi:hypothetical protein